MVKIKKKYKIGMYGGKFMPFHLGHLHCLEKAIEECEKVYLVLCVNGLQEKEIHRKYPDAEYLSIEARWEVLNKVKELNPKVIIPAIMDVDKCILPNGEEDWDAETPLMRAICGNHIDVVYGSEPSYADYFKRAYPESEYHLVDVDRSNFNISGTKCREMDEKERSKWVFK